MSVGPGPSESPLALSGRHRPGRLGFLLAVAAVAVVVALAGYGTYAYLASRGPSGEPTLTIYTYASLFGGADCNSPVFDSVFGAFGRAHSVHVVVDCPAGTLVSTLASQRGSPGADLAIGLDEVTTPQAEALHLLVPYRSPALADVPSGLPQELSPDFGATPYEFGYLAFDYNTSFLAATHGAVANASFPDFAENSSWARQLVVEDPTTDITGEELLLWQVEFYETVLHENWQGFWASVDPYVHVAPDWSSAFAEFTTPPNSPQMVVSYSTDPAYAAFSGTPGAFNATLSSWNGTEYGWKTVYGIGIVNGTAHLGLDEKFIDWFLSGAVQGQIPTNEWEYPANDTVPLPAVFDSAVNLTGVVALNDRISPPTIAADLPTWLDTWQSLANQYG